MMTTYVIPIYARLEQAIPSIGELVDSVNQTMHEFGFHEQMSIQSVIAHITVHSNRPFSRPEALLYQQTAQEAFDKKLDFEVRVADFDEWRIE